MDLLKQINDKIKSKSDLSGAAGLRSILTHIEIAERHHHRAKSERDEHLFTDVIYRTNHAFEGILKEAYRILAEKPADRLNPHEIEEYLLSNNILRSRVADLLKNYRQHWRNPSTHDYQLFFSEQESYLAIVNVSAFVSILLDQVLEKIAYAEKFSELKNAARLAREKIKNYESLSLVDKVMSILLSFSRHYLNNFASMSRHARNTANAQLSAFISTVAPELNVDRDVLIVRDDQEFLFDMVVCEGTSRVAIETRGPRSRNLTEAHILSEAAIEQLAARLRAADYKDGVIFFYPGASDDEPIATLNSTAWPKDVNLREVYGADPSEIPDTDDRDDDYEPTPLIDE